ncbi:MAG TPA: RNA 2',3'-cyclic phosphodiesterase, partial [Terriglobales bacterium]|nr:RNA 2',3'-cyclic phosphodiesterase [Terriglobales bacterium]
SLHLTLKFIGESDQLDAIRESLQTIHSPAVELAFCGAGFFPTPRSPRVFWIGIESDERLAALARGIDEALAPLGIAREAHAFTPHITLARSGSGRPQLKAGDARNSRFALLQKRLAAMLPPDLGTMTAREFFLYQSKTAPTGAVYTKLARFELSG